MLDIKPEVAVAAVQEASKTLVPALEGMIERSTTRILEGFKSLLSGREITITIK